MGAGDIPEISDLIIDFDPDTLQRLAVRRETVVSRFEELGRRREASIVARLPVVDGILDPLAVDAVLLRAHLELQRLNEEFQQGPRVLELLAPTVRALRRLHPKRRIRVVDVGCGLGFIVRYLAMIARQQPDLLGEVELLGCDYNASLVTEARRLARAENLACEFQVANAFRLEEGGEIFLSSGVLHHFRGEGLSAFFGQHRDARAFFHFDIESSWLAPIGAWIFHRARMREPLARNDGVRSAIRAHGGKRLLDAAEGALPDFRVGLFRAGHPTFPVMRTMRPVVGVHRDVFGAWTSELGARGRLLSELRP